MAGRGGGTRPHLIEARRGGYDASGRFVVKGRLRFKLGGRWHVRESVRHPGNLFPQRDYLRVDEARVQRSLDASLGASAGGLQ